MKIINPRDYRLDPAIGQYMPHITSVTVCNLEALLDARGLQRLMLSGKWITIRRAGRKQLWLGYPDRFLYPWVGGLHNNVSGFITEQDFKEEVKVDVKCETCPWEPRFGPKPLYQL